MTNRDMSSAEAIRFGIVTALPKEYAAVRTMLDADEDYTAPRGREYILGSVPAKGGGIHRLAVALADQGNTISAVRATQLVDDFPEVEAILMVGIAGGVPFPARPDRHVRLGDVVVSGEQGLVAYDFVKEHSDRLEPRHPPRPPDHDLYQACRRLEAADLAADPTWTQNLDRATHLQSASRPAVETDRLADTLQPNTFVEHPWDPDRVPDRPRIFLGTIACANRLLKNPVHRDELRNSFDVRAVEMEGSGIAEAAWSQGLGYLVVRGICDYCDKNKNDTWQGYAAAVAAAYARTILGEISARPPGKELAVARVRSSAVPEDRLREAARALLDAGTPPSLLKDLEGARIEAERALSELMGIPRLVTNPEKPEVALQFGELLKHERLHHVIEGPPGAGKTHALWRAAQDLLARPDVIPLYVSASNASSWAEMLESLSTAAGGEDPSNLLGHPSVCLFLDGWSELGGHSDSSERNSAAQMLHRTRILATARLRSHAGASFLPWRLVPVSVSEVRKTIQTALPDAPALDPAFFEFLRLPLALSLYVLLDRVVTSAGELMARFHEHVSRGLPEVFRSVLSGAVAAVDRFSPSRSRQQFVEELRSRAAKVGLSDPVDLVSRIGTLDLRRSSVVPIHDLYWNWLSGTGLISEGQVPPTASYSWAREAISLAIESGSAPQEESAIQVASVDVRIATELCSALPSTSHAVSEVRSRTLRLLDDERLSFRCRGAIATFCGSDDQLVRPALEAISALESATIHETEFDGLLDVDRLFEFRGTLAGWIGQPGTDRILEAIARRGDGNWSNWLQQMAYAGKLTWPQALGTALACANGIPPWSTDGHLKDLIAKDGWRLRAVAERGVNTELARWIADNYQGLVDAQNSRFVDLNRLLVSCADDATLGSLLDRFPQLEPKTRELLSFAIADRGDPWLARFQKAIFIDGRGMECRHLLEKPSKDIDDETARRWIASGPALLGWRVLIARHGTGILRELLDALPASFDGQHVIPALEALSHLTATPEFVADDLWSRVGQSLGARAGADLLSALAPVENHGIASVVAKLIRRPAYFGPYHLFYFLRLLRDWEQRTGLNFTVRENSVDASFAAWIILKRLPELQKDSALKSHMHGLATYLVPILLPHLDSQWSLVEIIIATGQIPAFNERIVEHLFQTNRADLIPNLFAGCLDAFPEQVLFRLLDHESVDFGTLLGCMAARSAPTHFALHRALIERVRPRPLDMREYRHLAQILRTHSRDRLRQLLQVTIDPQNDRDMWLIREVEKWRGQLVIDESGRWLP